MISELHARDRALTIAGAVMLLGFLIATLLSIGDPRLILGVNPWLKPMKFFASNTIVLWTVAWFMAEARPQPRARAVIRWTFVTAMAAEITLISMQAVRGTTSHFNVATPFDSMVFNVIGAANTISTVAGAGLLWLLRRDTPPQRAGYLWGMRLGLAIFVLGSLQGFTMVANMGYAVPGPDGGPGLPLVNWSTSGGDLRVAHFAGLHALQALPLLGFLLDRAGLMPSRRRTVVLTVGVVWLLVVGSLVTLALQGRPLVGM